MFDKMHGADRFLASGVEATSLWRAGGHGRVSPLYGPDATPETRAWFLQTGGIVNQQLVPAPKRPLSRTRKTAVAMGALIAAPLLMASTACGSNNADTHDGSTAAAKPAAGHTSPAATPATHPSPSAGPAQKLADLDGNLRPADQYQQVLSALAPRCKEDLPHLATVVDTTLKAVKKKGGSDEDEFSVLQKLEAWVPAGKPRANCASEATAYVAQREK
ncbi:hypothetical protein [Streptomyces sp. NPDC001401]|uniref:hypothetical protein n=1 Tax=Streptomyces sp. NPDC001401 TaxID=3364570 RepID=UPI003695608C